MPVGLPFGGPDGTMLTPARESGETRQQPGRTVSGVCHGTLGELCQGPLRTATSTADIVATPRCLFRLFALPYDTGVVLGILTGIERADGVFLGEFALYLSGRHRVIRRLGTDIGFHTAYITGPGTVDTTTVTDLLLEQYRRHGEEYERCRTDPFKGFASGHSASAALSQNVLPKATFDSMLAHRERFVADGTFVAHTGCLIGCLFPNRPGSDVESDLSAYLHSLGHQCSFAQGGYG
ncbi:hypothetical protein [Streptomyces sp. NPDC015345]|uniref:hypothetical protein n=1 Tax=Streptomyces sp. NPDC015345 TaxID=3364953 RepID=UPI0036FDAE4A